MRKLVFFFGELVKKFICLLYHDDTRRHEETPLFVKNLLQCKAMRCEIALGSEPDRGSEPTDLYGQRVPLLGESPERWIITVAQRYIVDLFVF